MIIRHAYTVSDGPVAALTGLVDLLVPPDSDLLYSVSGSYLQLWDPGDFTGLDGFHFAAGSGLGAPGTGLALRIGERPALLLAGPGGDGLDGVWLDPAGRPDGTLRLDLPAGAGPHALLALAALDGGGQSVLVGAGRQQADLQVWTLTGDAGLAAVAQSLPLGLPAGSVSALVPAGPDQLLVLSATGDALLRLRLAEDGQLSLLARIDPRDGLWVETPTHLALVEVAGQAYAVVGAQGSDSVSVIALNADGGMQVTDHVIDTRATRFADLSVLETIRIDGQSFVVAGGSDDGVSVLTVLPGGRLLHLASRADDTVTALTDPVALALLPGIDGFDIAVAGQAPDGGGPGLTRLSVDLGPVGDVLVAAPQGSQVTGQGGDDILIDGGGADWLTGGAGRDVFVLLRDGQRDVITDFERGTDRLDLSDQGRAYTVAALDIRPQSWGAEIHLGTDVVELRSADGTPLTAADFTISDLLDLHHAPVAPLSLGDQDLTGGAQADFLQGRDGSDTIWGGGGRDVLIGQGGDDWLHGERPDAAFDPASGQIYRLYKAVLGRDPDLQGLFGWSDQLLAGTRDLTDVAAGFVQSGEFQSVYGALSHAGFVEQLYLNVLGRAPDAAGFAHWTAQLESGALRREQVVTGFSESAEFVAATGAAATAVTRAGLQAAWSDDVVRLYRATLDRPPDLPGFLHWTAQLAEGRAFESVVAGFTGSAEFRAAYGETSDPGFVTLLYQNVLGRAPDAAGFAQWLARLSAPEVSRETVVTGFAQSPEFQSAMAMPVQDWIGGQGIDDTLDGGAGVNVLQGGVLADRFVFRAGPPAHHIVTDPEPWDVFAFEGFGYENLSDLMGHVTPQAGDLLFSDQGVQVTWIGLSEAALEATQPEF